MGTPGGGLNATKQEQHVFEITTFLRVQVCQEWYYNTIVIIHSFTKDESRLKLSNLDRIFSPTKEERKLPKITISIFIFIFRAKNQLEKINSLSYIA